MEAGEGKMTVGGSLEKKGNLYLILLVNSATLERAQTQG